MASIHVIYDPNDKITGMTPDQLRSIKASAIVYTVAEDITIHTIDHVIARCTELLIEQIALTEEEIDAH